MAKWFVAAKKADFEGIARDFGISPVLARILRNRELTTREEIEKFLHGTLQELYPPLLLADLEKAVAYMKQAAAEGKRIRIIGDYDVDGICSTYILWRGFTALGAAVDTVIPHRMRDGYGLNAGRIDQAARDGVQVIITCDNGIAAASEIAYAGSLGIRVVVTDHHEVPYLEEEGEKTYLLPPAEAVVDPKREGDTYPWKGICGAVVAFKFVQVLWEMPDWDGTQVSTQASELEELLEFAAFATICDVMELLDENRILVKEGLARMRHTRNPGLRALMEVNGLDPSRLSAYHVGFVLGPCLNATGRLDTAARALDLLKARCREEAVSLASELKLLNDSRKEMTEYHVKEAIRQVEEQGLGKDRVLVLYLPACHESLAGIIAGRVREKYHKPVFVLTDGEEGVKGSGRSIDSYHMYEEMSRHKELFCKYGGHKLAAGLSMAAGNVEVFRKAINESCRLTPSELEEKIHIDVPMPLSYVTEAFVKELALLEPFGPGNPKPVFAQKNLRFVTARIFGKNRNVVRCKVLDEAERAYEVLYFGDITALQDYIAGKFGQEKAKALFEAQAQGISLMITYYPSLNEYRGKTSLQFVMQQYQ